MLADTYKAVGGFAHAREDVGIVLGDVGGDLLLDFLELSWPAGVFDHGEVRILHT